MTGIASKIVKVIPGGATAEAPIGLVGDVINLIGTAVKEKDLVKLTRQFQEILAKDKKNLSLFDENYRSLAKVIWGDNEKSKISNIIVDSLKIVQTKPYPFSDEHSIANASKVWQGRTSLGSGEMKNSIELVIKNLEEFRKELQNEKEQLVQQGWFKVIEQKTDLLQEQQVQIGVIPKGDN